MSIERFANSAQPTLSAAISSTSATSINVASASGFPSQAQYRIRIDDEIMLVTAGAGTTTWTVTRGVEGTTAATHNNGAGVYHILTKASLLAIEEVTAVCEGRLTGTSGSPVTDADVSGIQNMFWSPYRGNKVLLWDPTDGGWRKFATDEISILLTKTATGTRTSGSAIITGLADTSQLVRGMKVSGTGIPGSTTIGSLDSASQVTLSANATSSGTGTLTFVLPANTNYDVFLVVASNAPKLQFGNAWSSSTARADALTQVNGVYVNNADINAADSNKITAQQGRYVGTVRTTSSDGYTEDSAQRRFIWNNSNRIWRRLKNPTETTDTWTYTTASYRQANNNTDNKVELVIGLSEEPVQVQAMGRAANSTANTHFRSGVGLDSTTANSAQILGSISAAATQPANTHALYNDYPGIGYHYLAWLEHSNATGTCTWQGDNGTPTTVQTGIMGGCFA